MEEIWIKYGYPQLLDLGALFCFFFFFLDETHPTRRNRCFMSGTKGCSEAAREYLNHVVQEICYVDKLNPFHHCPHFPFFMTHFTDSMPISSIGGIWSAYGVLSCGIPSMLRMLHMLTR